MSDFAGKTVVVTGAGGALGSGLATAFTAAGATVIGVDRAAPDERALVSGVRYETADLGDDSQVAALFGAIDTPWAVVHTVGGFAPHVPLTQLDPEVLDRQLALNLCTAAVVTKHALRVMRAVGSGRIVHTSSRAATTTTGSGFAYSVSKLGVLHLVAMAADEIRGTGITINTVVPSIIDTPANRAAMPDADHDSWPKIHAIAHTYLFLASPKAGLVNGSALAV